MVVQLYDQYTIVNVFEKTISKNTENINKYTQFNHQNKNKVSGYHRLLLPAPDPHLMYRYISKVVLYCKQILRKKLPSRSNI